MSSELFYSFLRISTAQTLRASGIDRCPPSVLDTLTDLTIRYMTLLSTKATANAYICGRGEVELGDLRFAMEQAGMLRPTRMLDETVNDGEVWGIDVEDEGLERFLEWCRTVPREIAAVTGGEELIDTLMKKQTNVSQEDRFKGTILDPSPPPSPTQHSKLEIEGGPGPVEL
ncbi:hypothetical protein BZA70DRAFT_291132 [Myxozyma melibiosi]|uniref:Bromodomain associated domain-containing protein n=1 Tax=Myxozyma melibiosi TaxID=54550 RepID=A0ABR1F124_9ASCO